MDTYAKHYISEKPGDAPISIINPRETSLGSNEENDQLTHGKH